MEHSQRGRYVNKKLLGQQYLAAQISRHIGSQVKNIRKLTVLTIPVPKLMII